MSAVIEIDFKRTVKRWRIKEILKWKIRELMNVIDYSERWNYEEAVKMVWTYLKDVSWENTKKNIKLVSTAKKKKERTKKKLDAMKEWENTNKSNLRSVRTLRK